MTTALSTGIRRAAARLAPDPTPDGELLSRFLSSRDEVAFAALVRRHAAMVFGTCRRVLGNAADADDAFQAAFVVLVRKAHALTDRACVGNFLYGVAFHTALKARAMATKRKAKEARASRERERPEPDELSRALDEELAHLPEKYREPVVLCELEGVSRRDAASRLGIPEGTISSRLATAHRMLEKRLKARGFATVAIAAMFGSQAFAVSDTLADAAVRAAVSGPPAGVTHLAAEVTKMFLLNKLRAGAAVLAGVVLMLGVGVGLVQRGTAADDKREVKAAPVKPAATKDEERIQGLWQAETVQVGGKRVPAGDVYKVLRMRFQGNTLTAITEDGERQEAFALDTSASPKKLTTHPPGKPKEKKVEFIYDLDGDTLKLCHNTLEGDAGPLPASFRAGPQDKDELIVFKRVTDAAEAIRGTWIVTELHQVGKKMTDEEKTFYAGGGYKITFTADTMTHEIDKSGMKYRLDPTRDEKVIEFIENGAVVALAIYDLSGDDLKLCVGRRTKPGMPPVAPTGFDVEKAPAGTFPTVYVMKRDKPPAIPDRQGAGAKKDEPAWKTEFRKAYGLKDGELIRRVAPPYPDCREEYFRADLERRMKRPATPTDLDDEANNFTVFRWKDGVSSAGWQTRTEPEVGVSLQFVIGTVLEIPRTRLESDQTTLDRKVTGDFIVRTGADPEKAAVQLEAILRKELELPVRFSFRDAEEEVFVLSGKYAAKPVDDRKANEIEVYANHLTERGVGGGGSGTLAEMAAALERHLSKPVVLGQVEGGPAKVSWHYNVRSPMLRDPAKGIDTYRDDTNPAQVLGRLAAQTGLTVATEKRKVRLLVVTHEEGKK